MRFVIVALAVLWSSLSHAEEFGGWKFTPPSGATRVAGSTAITFTLIDNSAKTFCRIGLYAVRAPGSDDFNQEWNEVVAPNFKIISSGDPVTAKVKNMALTAKTAKVEKDGGTYAAALYVLQPAGGVSSVMLLSTNEASIAKCPIRPFLDSITLAKAPAPAPTTTSQPAQPAGAPALTRIWTAGSSNFDGQGVSHGSVKRQYDFKTDGTYQYFREAWGGRDNPAWYFTMLETGAWKLDGDQLALTPKKVIGTGYDTKNNTKKAVKIALEPATYAVKIVWMSGIEMWNLVMTIDKPTARDGSYAVNDGWPHSYLLDTRNNQQFRFPPK
jgi:hypothetical protein